MNIGEVTEEKCRKLDNADFIELEEYFLIARFFTNTLNLENVNVES